MASGKTTNIELNQYALTDEFKMDDFNSDNQKIDSAYANLADMIAEKGMKKIAEFESSTPAKACDFDISDLGLDEYEIVALDITCTGGSSNMTMYIEPDGISSGSSYKDWQGEGMSSAGIYSKDIDTSTNSVRTYMFTLKGLLGSDAKISTLTICPERYPVASTVNKSIGQLSFIRISNHNAKNMVYNKMVVWGVK